VLNETLNHDEPVADVIVLTDVEQEDAAMTTTEVAK
jgi:hypothetical protein